MSVLSVLVIIMVEGTSLALELASVYFLIQSGFGGQAAGLLLLKAEKFK